MNLSQSLHGSILFQEAKGLPESDLGLFSLLFLFWKCNGHVPESPWSYSRKWMTSSSQTFSLDLFFLFLFQGHNSLVQKCPWTFFIVVFVFVLFLFWGCNGPVPKRVHGATPKSPWPPPALVAWPACGPSAAPWQRLRSATSHGISASCPLGKICWLKTRGHLVTVLESFSI